MATTGNIAVLRPSDSDAGTSFVEVCVIELVEVSVCEIVDVLCA